MAHTRWYLDSADIPLNWFHGTYPEGEAAIREGMANLQDAYLRLAGELTRGPYSELQAGPATVCLVRAANYRAWR